MGGEQRGENGATYDSRLRRPTYVLLTLLGNEVVLAGSPGEKRRIFLLLAPFPFLFFRVGIEGMGEASSSLRAGASKLAEKHQETLEVSQGKSRLGDSLTLKAQSCPSSGCLPFLLLP